MIKHISLICILMCGLLSVSGLFAQPCEDCSFVIADFNGDGYDDVAVVDFDHNRVCVSLGNKDGSFDPPVCYSVGANPICIVTADFNSDGYLDLAVANRGSNTVSVLLGNGDGTFQPAQNYAVGQRPVSIAVGDFNGDGIPDLVVANSGSASLSILIGIGDGTFRAALNFATAHEPLCVRLGDFDGDGCLDIMIVYRDTTCIWYGDCRGGFQSVMLCLDHSSTIGDPIDLRPIP